MASKKTIYLTTASEDILGPDLVSLSGRVNSIICRYGEMIAEAYPEFSEAEWSAICDALNGVWLQVEAGNMDPARYTWMKLADSGLGEKWGIDLDALALRVKKMPYAAQVAIVEVATKFWKSPQLNVLATIGLLRQSGAKVS